MGDVCTLIPRWLFSTTVSPVVTREVSGRTSHPTLSQCESLGNFVSFVCFPGCSVADNNPSVDENNPPGYVVTTIHVEQGFTVAIDPTSPDASFFTIQGSELQLSRSVDYEVSRERAGCEDEMGSAEMQ